MADQQEVKPNKLMVDDFPDGDNSTIALHPDKIS